MTNLSSRAVISGKTAPLIFYIGSLPEAFPTSPSGAKYFSLKGLLDVLAVAIGKWIETYKLHREKFADFVRRYDLIISDSRVAYFQRGAGLLSGLRKIPGEILIHFCNKNQDDAMPRLVSHMHLRHGTCSLLEGQSRADHSFRT